MNPADAVTAARSRLSVPQDIDSSQLKDLAELFIESCEKYSSRPMVTSLGNTLSYAEVREGAEQFASFLQNYTQLQFGDRVALQMPNVAQYFIAFYGTLLAGMVVVNTNPLYTAKELKHQLIDSGAKVLVVLENVAHTAAKIISETAIEKIVITKIADMHPLLSRTLTHFAVKHIKKMVPQYDFDQAITFREVLKLGSRNTLDRPDIALDDLAMLQYTGGTTGLAKGAMLAHRMVASNIMQASEVFKTYEGFVGSHEGIFVLPLPLYHIFSCTVSGLLGHLGLHALLIPNPRDIPGMVKAMKSWRIAGLAGLNTLFVALCNNEDFKALDFSHMKLTISGGTALTSAAANQWQAVTQQKVFEGYGLTETAPMVSVNPGTGQRLGTIGIPMPGTEIKVVDDNGNSLACGEAGELCVRGPQVMQGYWQLPDKTAEVIDNEGWFATGDIAEIDVDGYIRIVDRKKDLVIVSGFNVYPNEVEDVLCQHQDVLEAAVVGVPDEKAGEAVAAYVVGVGQPNEKDIRLYCREYLTAYKVPKYVVFVDELPKTNVGKILRRSLREPQWREKLPV